jgi:hypothetical protein
VAVGVVDRRRTRGTRFRNGSSVADSPYHLACGFIWSVGGWTRAHFVSASRRATHIFSWLSLLAHCLIWLG